MTPDDYNRKQYDKNLLTMSHISRLVSFWQQEHGLEPDGKCGVDTRALLDAVHAAPPPEDYGLLLAAWNYARPDVGKGGDGARNNEGVYLDEIRQRTNLPKLGAGAWCAVGISNWCILANAKLGHAIKSRSAQQLVRNAILAGAVEVEPEELAVGAVVIGLYSRGNINSGLHHVRLLRRGEWVTWQAIGANERGDKVRFRTMTATEVEQRLVKLVRI